MPSSKRIKSRIYTGCKIILFAFVIALIVRAFFIESYRIPSVQMENSILPGDFILVDKTAYGIRLPVSIPNLASLPDSISLNNKRYPLYFHIPYTRFQTSKVNRNDIVVYNIPTQPPGSVPVDRTPVSIGRCIGLPGDSLEVTENGYVINGQKYPLSPDMILPYHYAPENKNTIESGMEKLNIPTRELNDDIKNIKCLSRFECYLIEDKFSDSSLLSLSPDNTRNYRILIPKKNMSVEITPDNIPEYKQIIMEQENGKVEFNDEKVIINGKPIKYYKFNNDYYWMLCDNPRISSDSRHFGFISHNHLIGKARLIWFSKDPNQSISSGYRWNRILTKPN